MTDLITRLRDADTTRRIGESYADTHERRQRDRDEAADRIEQLEKALRVSVQYLPYWRPKTELARQIKLDTLAMIRAALEEK